MSGNNQITQTISPFIPQQVPEFLQAGSPNFVAFIKAYYEWLEQGNVAITTDSFQLLSYKDIDQTTSQFIQFFINDFLPLFPNNVALDERKLIKQARNFYQKKGSVESIQFLFRVLYNKEADIYFPKNNILKCSAGKWVQPQALDLLAQNLNGFDVTQLIGRQGVGSVSNATCTIESAAVTLDPGLGIEIVEIFISNIVGTFSDLENLNVIYGFDSNGNPLVFTEKIIASISNVLVDPNNRGLNYVGFSSTYPGDPVVFIGGLESNDPLATPAVAFVNSVTSGSITGIVVEFGGYNYRVFPNTEVTVVPAPGDITGTGANVEVTGIDSGNSIFKLVQTDAIYAKSGLALNTANYDFVNIASANINTVIGQAFSYANLQFGPINLMNVINGGADYTATPNLDMAVTYYTDLATALLGTGNTIQFMDDLGYIAAVNIVSGGQNYSTITDEIIVPSGVGYGATFSFTVNATGTIETVTVTNPGNGYFYFPYQLAVANNTNTAAPANGTGAILTGFGYGQGALLEVLVNQIGQILDFRIVSRGFDYVSTPNVSLRVEDLQIVDPGMNLSFQSGTVAFQGANANDASYSANISSYNVSSQTLRLYNYQGTFNSAANLNTTTGNVVANLNNSNFLVVYGNGLAKANAIFLNGLIKFPGFFLDTSGFLSSDQHLQSGDKYHNYSYVVQVEQALNDYKNTLMKLVHPTGMQLLGTFLVQQQDLRNVSMNAPVQIIPNAGGTVSSNAFSSANLLVGSGTTFSSNASPGDLVVFNTSDTSRKLQVKQVLSAPNAGNIIMVSNTFWIYPYGVTVNTSSNLVSGNLVTGNIGVNDIIEMNIAGNAQTSIVQTLGANSFTVNTVFNANAANLVVLVWPSINAATYEILKNPS